MLPTFFSYLLDIKFHNSHLSDGIDGIHFSYLLDIKFHNSHLSNGIDGQLEALEPLQLPEGPSVQLSQEAAGQVQAGQPRKNGSQGHDPSQILFNDNDNIYCVEM